MTVSTEENTAYSVGNGITVDFPFAFLTLDESHVTVALNNVPQSAGFTVTLNVDQAIAPGGDVSFDVAPESGVQVAIVRAMPAVQETDYQAFDPFPSETHEAALDYLTLLFQEVRTTSDRVFGFADSVADVGGTKVLTSAVDRASKILSFDAAGNLISSQEIGVWTGDWSSPRQYSDRDLWRDPATLNVYIVTTGHEAVSVADSILNSDILIDSVAAGDSANRSEAAALLSQAWAESSTEPDGVGTKSSKTWAGEAESAASTAATDAVDQAQAAIAADVQAAEDAATLSGQHATASADSAAASAQSAQDAQDAADSISGGPVTSVNGETGVVVLDALDVGAIPATGGTFTGAVRFDNFMEVTDGATNSFRIYQNGSSQWRMRSYQNGYTIAIQGYDTSGSLKTMLTADPDGETIIRFAGSTRMTAVSGGIDVVGGVVTDDGVDKVVDTRAGTMQFWSGTQAQYDALTPNADTVYFISG